MSVVSADAVLHAIVEGVAARGYAVVRDFLPTLDVDVLRAAALAHDRADAMTAAAIGRGEARAVRGSVRGDRIRWIDAAAATPAEQRLLDALDALRLAANRAMQLGLFELEAHYAIYPSGVGYARHVDRFQDDDARVLSLVLYLNAGWRADEGGALRLSMDDGRSVDIAPDGGTMVTFLAERFPHEVQAATRERISIAGWFRRRT